MAKIDNLVLHGVGEAYLLSPDGKIATRLSKMQSMSIEVTSESEDVYGGDKWWEYAKKTDYYEEISLKYIESKVIFDER